MLEAHWERKVRLAPAEQSKRYRERNREAIRTKQAARPKRPRKLSRLSLDRRNARRKALRGLLKKAQKTP